MPRRRAARKMVSPSRMSTGRSSMLKVLGLSPELELMRRSSLQAPSPRKRHPSCVTRWPLEYGFPLTRERHVRALQHFHHQLPSGFAISSGKYFSTHSSGLGAAWPSPQIEASRMASESSVNNAWSQGPVAISVAAFSVPARQGVHWPQLSSSKKRIRLSATAFISSLSERTTTACDPTKQPYCSSVPKSSGKSAIVAGRIPPEATPGREEVEPEAALDAESVSARRAA